MGRITVFSLPGCTNCSRVMEALEERSIPYLEINLSVHHGKFMDMTELAGNRIVPQVFFNETLIGGVDEILAVLATWDEEKFLFPTALDRYKKEIELQPNPTDPRLCLPGELLFGSNAYPELAQFLGFRRRDKASMGGSNFLGDGAYPELASFLQFNEPGKSTPVTQASPMDEPSAVETQLMEESTIPSDGKESTIVEEGKQSEEVQSESAQSKDTQTKEANSSPPARAGRARKSVVFVEDVPQEKPSKFSVPEQQYPEEKKSAPPPQAPVGPLIQTPGGGVKLTPPAMAKKLEQIIPRSNQRFLGRMYRDVFKGSEGVKAIMKHYDLSRNEEAIAFGVSLQKEWKLLDHVKGEHVFGDNDYFFKLLPSGQGESIFGLPKLQHAAHDLLQGVEVKDRRFRLKSYQQCFLGSEGVNYLVSHGHVQNRDQAVLMGKEMQTKLKLFVHVTNEHEFKDEGLFYRFT